MRARSRTTPRKIPRQERSRATIDAILTATARILVQDGFDRASTNRVAEAAGVSIGSLYQYFPSKEALVAALAERHIEEMLGVLVAAFDRLRALPLAEATREMVSLLLGAHAIDPKLHQVLTEQVPRIGRMDRVHDVERTVRVMVRTYLEEHRAELRVNDLDLSAFIAVQTVEALTHSALVHGTRFDHELLTDEITALIVRYLARQPPPPP
jgi:AcrR family transcriptional regulator